MKSKKAEKFRAEMEGFTEISFVTETLLSLTQIVVKPASGGRVEFFRRTVTGALVPFCSADSRQAFLSELYKLNLQNWKKRYKLKPAGFSARRWELTITLSGGIQKKYAGANSYPPDFYQLSKLLKISLAV